MRYLLVFLILAVQSPALEAADVHWRPRGGVIVASNASLFGGVSLDIRANRHPAGLRFDFGFGPERSVNRETDPYGENKTAAEAYVGTYFTWRTQGRAWFGVKGGAAWTHFGDSAVDHGGVGAAAGMSVGYRELELDYLFTRIAGESVQIWSIAVGF